MRGRKVNRKGEKEIKGKGVRKIEGKRKRGRSRLLFCGIGKIEEYTSLNNPTHNFKIIKTVSLFKLLLNSRKFEFINN